MDEFNENERKILAYLYGNGQITVKIASETIEMSDATAPKLLRGLVEKISCAGIEIQKRSQTILYN